MSSNQSGWVKVLLVLFGLSYLLNGVAMLFLPDTWFFRLVPGVPETGPFNSHLVRDIGTFYLPFGLALVYAARDPGRHALAVAIAAAAGALHGLLHIYSHYAGWLSGRYLATEAVLIYLPSALLVVLAAILMRPAANTARSEKSPAARPEVA